jgi:hypothetical protein
MKILALLVSAAICAAQTPPTLTGGKTFDRKKVAPKKAAEAAYDPDKLGPSEIACGRTGAKNAHPCECMKHRVKLADAARDKCMTIVDDKQRLACGLAADACHVTGLVDADVYRSGRNYDDDGNPLAEPAAMPQQCARSCSKARCECCKT